MLKTGLRSSRFTYLVALLLAVALLVSACGGGSGSPDEDEQDSQAEPANGAEQTGNGVDAEPTTTDGETTDNQAEITDQDGSNATDDSDAAFEQFAQQLFDPTGPRDILEKFSRLSYKWENFTGSQLESSLEVKFAWLGQEELAGTTVDKISLTIVDDTEGTEDEMEIWLAADGETVRAITEGEEIPPEISGILTNSLLGVLTMPFKQFDIIFRNPWEDGRIRMTSHQVERQKIAGHNATVQTYRGGGDLADLDEDTEFEIEVAKFSEFEMMLRGEIFDEENNSFVMTPLELELR